MKQSLHLKTSQQLSLTPELQQSLKLLQLSAQELEQAIQTALDENPLLERDDEPEPEGEITEASLELDASGEDTQSTLESGNVNSLDFEAASSQSPLDCDWDDSAPTLRLEQENLGSELNGFDEQLSHHEVTLNEHLEWQIGLTRLTRRETLIARALIGNLDTDGYLRSDWSKLCQSLSDAHAVSQAELDAGLHQIQQLDPAGVGARSLAERLRLIIERQVPDSAMRSLSLTVINDHLDHLAKRNFPALKKALSIDDETLSACIHLITSISPRIGGQFGAVNSSHITPDLIVKRVGERWRATINPANQHRLKLNADYQRLLDADVDQNSRTFIRERLQQAKTFIKSVMSRYDTLQLVGERIVQRQQDFFARGALHMTPMTLADIATELEMHESTISRATAGKYLQSPQGVYELKYFFSSGLERQEGDAISSTAIRALINQLIKEENKRKPLSDAALERQLLDHGYKVARRTVAKYREALGLPASSQRKSL